MGTLQRIFSSRSAADANSYIGRAGHIFYEESDTPGVAPIIKYSDGITPGGIPISGNSGGSGSVNSIEVSGGTTGLTTDGGPITSSGTITLNGVLNVAAGGTGANNPVTARTNLDAARRGNNNDITSLSGLTTPLSVEQGGTGANSLAGYLRGNNADSFTATTTIPFSDITGVVPVSQGGTGQSTLSAGVLVSDGTTISTTNFISGSVIDGNISGNSLNVTGVVEINHGGTGGNTPSSARIALGVAKSGANGDITSLSGLTTPLSIDQGGTGASTSSDALSALLPSQTGNTNKVLITDGTSASWGSFSQSRAARVLVVGIDAATIQECIDLASNVSAANAYIVQIPPGRYIENLTLRGGVMIQGMGNQADPTSVVITGYHTLNGAALNALSNTVSVANIVFAADTSLNPVFSISGTTATQFNVQGCYIQNTNINTSAHAFQIGTNVSLYLDNCNIQMVAGSGTQFNMSGGSIYLRNVRSNSGSKIINMSAPAYAELTYSTLSCAGTSEAITVYGNGAAEPFPLSGLVSAGWTSIQNTASNGNGVNLAASGASMLAYSCSFDVLADASNYVVTGVAGTSFVQLNNNYANIPGILSRNIKIKNTVALLTHSSSLSSSA
jgi:hypothetical protein